MPTEAEFEETDEAVAGRALLEAGLAKVGETEQQAFRDAVRRCYASAAQEEPPPDENG